MEIAQIEFVLMKFPGLIPLTNQGSIIDMLSVLVQASATEQVVNALAFLDMRARDVFDLHVLIVALVTANAHT